VPNGGSDAVMLAGHSASSSTYRAVFAGGTSWHSITIRDGVRRGGAACARRDHPDGVRRPGRRSGPAEHARPGARGHCHEYPGRREDYSGIIPARRAAQARSSNRAPQGHTPGWRTSSGVPELELTGARDTASAADSRASWRTIVHAPRPDRYPASSSRSGRRACRSSRSGSRDSIAARTGWRGIHTLAR
jgi:hypothetical protein